MRAWGSLLNQTFPSNWGSHVLPLMYCSQVRNAAPGVGRARVVRALAQSIEDPAYSRIHGLYTYHLQVALLKLWLRRSKSPYNRGEAHQAYACSWWCCFTDVCCEIVQVFYSGRIRRFQFSWKWALIFYLFFLLICKLLSIFWAWPNVICYKGTYSSHFSLQYLSLLKAYTNVTSIIWAHNILTSHNRTHNNPLEPIKKTALLLWVRLP
jgi:hypothetical protein